MNLYENIPIELELIYKKIQKKDQTTKLKGFNELSLYCDNFFIDFDYIFIKYGNDEEDKIRLICYEILVKLVKYKKKMLNFIKKSIGIWVLGMNDTFTKEIANYCFNLYFNNHSKVFAFYKDEIKQMISGNLKKNFKVKETVDSLKMCLELYDNDEIKSLFPLMKKDAHFYSLIVSIQLDGAELKNIIEYAIEHPFNEIFKFLALSARKLDNEILVKIKKLVIKKYYTDLQLFVSKLSKDQLDIFNQGILEKIIAFKVEPFEVENLIDTFLVLYSSQSQKQLILLGIEYCLSFTKITKNCIRKLLLASINAKIIDFGNLLQSYYHPSKNQLYFLIFDCLNELNNEYCLNELGNEYKKLYSKISFDFMKFIMDNPIDEFMVSIIRKCHLNNTNAALVITKYESDPPSDILHYEIIFYVWTKIKNDKLKKLVLNSIDSLIKSGIETSQIISLLLILDLDMEMKDKIKEFVFKLPADTAFLPNIYALLYDDEISRKLTTFTNDFINSTRKTGNSTIIIDNCLFSLKTCVECQRSNILNLSPRFIFQVIAISNMDDVLLDKAFQGNSIANLNELKSNALELLNLLKSSNYKFTKEFNTEFIENLNDLSLGFSIVEYIGIFDTFMELEDELIEFIRVLINENIKNSSIKLKPTMAIHDHLILWEYLNEDMQEQEKTIQTYTYDQDGISHHARLCILITNILKEPKICHLVFENNLEWIYLELIKFGICAELTKYYECSPFYKHDTVNHVSHFKLDLDILLKSLSEFHKSKLFTLAIESYSTLITSFLISSGFQCNVDFDSLIAKNDYNCIALLGLFKFENDKTPIKNLISRTIKQTRKQPVLDKLFFTADLMHYLVIQGFNVNFEYFNGNDILKFVRATYDQMVFEKKYPNESTEQLYFDIKVCKILTSLLEVVTDYLLPINMVKFITDLILYWFIKFKDSQSADLRAVFFNELLNLWATAEILLEDDPETWTRIQDIAPQVNRIIYKVFIDCVQFKCERDIGIDFFQSKISLLVSSFDFKDFAQDFIEDYDIVYYLVI
jgi:hypothetical protein